MIMTADAENYGMLVKQAKLLLPRLEKITSDSSWAHRASGCRGSLIRLLEVQRENQNPGTSLGYTRYGIGYDDFSDLRSALDLGFEILEKAAAERFG